MSSFPPLTLPVRTSVKQKNLLQLGYNNLEHWLSYPQNEYVGRKGRIFIGTCDNKRVFHYPQSKWGNPFKVGDSNWTIENVLQGYRNHLFETGLINNIDELLGKNIGCFCDYGQQCHTDVLINLLKEKYPHLQYSNVNSRNNFGDPVFIFSS